MTIFILGGILGHLGFGLYDNFHLGGVFWDTSDLDSLTIFILGGGEGEGEGSGRGRGVFYRIGVFCGIWTKISTTPAGSCITDSLSHTTYVETNKIVSLAVETEKCTLNTQGSWVKRGYLVTRGVTLFVQIQFFENKFWEFTAT